MPLDLTFIAEDEREVSLRGYFGAKPVILTFVYYECPMLCTLVLNGLTSALKAVPFTAGEDYAIVTLSIDPARDAGARAGKEGELRAGAPPSGDRGPRLALPDRRHDGDRSAHSRRRIPLSL